MCCGVLLGLLQGCNSIQQLKEIHTQVLIHGYQHHLPISTKLLSSSAAAGDLSYARLLLSHHLPNPHTHHFNSLIRASSQTPSPLLSLSFFSSMLRSSSSRPDAITFSFLLLASHRAKALPECRQAHASLIRTGFPSHVLVCTNLFRSYAENGSIEDARKVFDEMPAKDLVSWNAMISCYSRAGLHEEVLRVYGWMRGLGVGLDEYTAVALLSSCAHVGALGLGRWVHRFAEDNGFLERNVFVGNALVDMYAKCGGLDAAREVFDGMWRRDVFTWNSMIIGLGIHGRGEEAVSFFERMLMAGIRPNSISFLGLLMGCTHQGLIDQGVKYFDLMSSEFGLKPELKHYGCMVDLFGRAGKLDKALEVIQNSSRCGDDPVSWRTLLSACKIYKNVEMGEIAMRNLVQLSAHNAGDCALLAGIYADDGDTEGVARMRKMVKDQGIKTTPGWSWIEVDGNVRKFVVGDISHPDTKGIHRKLREIIHRAVLLGYAAENSKSLAPEDFAKELSDEWMEKGGGYHSEMLALAYGLMRSPKGMGLRIVKNLRICKDCHSLMKFVSRAFSREIIVRDRVRFHHFKDESCSCKDYW